MYETNETREEILSKRAAAKKEYGALFDAVSEVLFRYDPQDINFGFNTDEYDIEAETILPRLRNCRSTDDVLTVVYEEFQKWFGAESVGETSRYQEISEKIWHLWQNRKTI